LAEAVKQQKHHHNDAAGAYRSDAHQEPATKPISDIQANDFIVGGRAAARSSIFFWKNRNVGMQISRTPTAMVMK